MGYGLLIDGAIFYAPNPIRRGGVDIITSDPTQYGYKKVFDEKPADLANMTWIADGWRETPDSIVRTWKMVPKEHLT